MNRELRRVQSALLRALGQEPRADVDPERNGEYALLAHLSRLPEAAQADAIVDVGANVGDWTAAALARFGDRPGWRYYCVEPIPDFIRQIREKHGARSNVEVLPVALSDRAGTSEIFQVGGGGRMQAPRYDSGDKAVVRFEIPLAVGDALLAPLRRRPYLIKIDCDGHDAKVLRGLQQTLRSARPLVQFEYCDFWIGQGERLLQACTQLYALQYRTYKLFPDCLRRFEARAWHESYGFQNVVAVPAEFASLQAARVALA